MTLLPMRKKCEVCGKQYNFNPSIGQINCPHCGALVGIKSDDFSLLEGVKQKDKLREK